MMNKKFLFMSLISIGQSNFCMDVVDVVPQPELVRLEDGHVWTRIADPRQADGLVNDIVAWRSDDIPGKGLRLDGHPDHHYAKIIDACDGLGPKLWRVWPHEHVILGEVPSLTVRLLTCAEARSWMRSPNTQPSAGAWIAIAQLNRLKLRNLMSNERLQYFLNHAPEFRTREWRTRARMESEQTLVCLLGLRRRSGNLVAQCPKQIMELIARQVLDAQMRTLIMNANTEEPLRFE